LAKRDFAGNFRAVMNEIEVLVGLLFAVAELALLASKLRLAYPILFVIGGLVLSFIPGLPVLQLRNDLVISDDVLRRIQRDIDLAEARFRHQ
jgi:hypothetical protein